MNRKQRAFAQLTDAEIEQIADWLRLDTYEKVRERIAKPRPEGFALQLNSTRPLETLWQKKNTVDKINRKLETGQKLTLAEFESIAAGEKADLPEQIHNAILETTYDRVLEGDGTPTQLLALQRLADFPARAEYREHKIEMDLHRKEMALHRKYIADERLALAKRSLDLREKRTSSDGKKHPSLPPGHYIDENGHECDRLGPLIRTPEDIRARAIKFYGFDARELARKAQERAQAQAAAAKLPDLSTPINTDISPADETTLINTGSHSGASTPTLTLASASTLSDTQEKEPIPTDPAIQ